MNWLKLLRHDLRCGLLRWRYLFVPVLFFMSCFDCRIHILNARYRGSWMDYMMNCFGGTGVFETYMEFPILWFVIMAGCLFINLDYPLNDLTEAGQQVIVRAVSKKSWYFSKCVWNLLSCGLYVLLGALTILVFVLATGGRITAVNTPRITFLLLAIYPDGVLPVGQAILAGILLPYLTVAAFSMLQMILCLVMRPVFSFLICVSALVASVFVYSPFMLGNGAMAARSGILLSGLLDPVATGLVSLGVIAASIIIGLIRFDRMDFLRYEG